MVDFFSFSKPLTFFVIMMPTGYATDKQDQKLDNIWEQMIIVLAVIRKACNPFSTVDVFLSKPSTNFSGFVAIFSVSNSVPVLENFF